MIYTAILPEGDGIPFVILFLSIQSVLFGALWLYPIIECAVHHPKTPKKDLWILCITVIPVIGGIIYLIFGRPVGVAGTSKENKEVV